jgi:hypothetical protein
MKETPTDHHPGSLTRYSPGVTTIEKDDKSRMRPTDANLGSSVKLPDIANEESVSFNYLKPGLLKTLFMGCFARRGHVF